MLIFSISLCDLSFVWNDILLLGSLAILYSFIKMIKNYLLWKISLIFVSVLSELQWNYPVCVCVSCSVISSSFTTLWTVTHQVPLSMEFSWQEFWSGLSFPSPGDLPDQGIKPRSPALQAGSLLPEPPEKSEYPECCLAAQSCPTLCDPMDCSTPGLPVPHHLP